VTSQGPASGTGWTGTEYTFTLTVTFGDFVVPVSTTPPAAGQVDNLGANYLALVGRSKFEIIPADLSATSPAASTPIPPNPLTSLSPKSS